MPTSSPVPMPPGNLSCFAQLRGGSICPVCCRLQKARLEALLCPDFQDQLSYTSPARGGISSAQCCLQQGVRPVLLSPALGTRSPMLVSGGMGAALSLACSRWLGAGRGYLSQAHTIAYGVRRSRVNSTGWLTHALTAVALLCAPGDNDILLSARAVK